MSISFLGQFCIFLKIDFKNIKTFFKEFQKLFCIFSEINPRKHVYISHLKKKGKEKCSCCQ